MLKIYYDRFWETCHNISKSLIFPFPHSSFSPPFFLKVFSFLFLVHLLSQPVAFVVSFFLKQSTWPSFLIVAASISVAIISLSYWCRLECFLMMPFVAPFTASFALVAILLILMVGFRFIQKFYPCYSVCFFSSFENFGEIMGLTLIPMILWLKNLSACAKFRGCFLFLFGSFMGGVLVSSA